MAAGAQAQAGTDTQQLGLYGGRMPPRRAVPAAPATAANPGAGPLCSACRAQEARYGFREKERVERSQTLCFACFRIEIDRRQRIAAQLARGWNAEQARLPLADTLDALDRRRRRAQIAARRALGL